LAAFAEAEAEADISAALRLARRAWRRTCAINLFLELP
jgi:hypothetical protein